MGARAGRAAVLVCAAVAVVVPAVVGAPGAAAAVPPAVPAAAAGDWTVTTVDPAGRPSISRLTGTTPVEAAGVVRTLRYAGYRTTAERSVTVRPAGMSNDTWRPAQWHLTKYKAESVWAKHPGKGVEVAVIDSGIDKSVLDFAGVFLPGKDYFNARGDGGIDLIGHGTAVAGFLGARANNGSAGAGLAQGVRIRSFRVFNRGTGIDADVAAALVDATDAGADVVNMSLGSPGLSTAMRTALDYAIARDVVLVAAAGNDGQRGSPTSYPGAYPGVITVAATGFDDTVAPFSNRSPRMDVAAPGWDVTSVAPRNGRTDGSGTSYASPIVAATAALLRAHHPTWTAGQVAQRITSTAFDIGTKGFDVSSGYGLLDVQRALGDGCGLPCAQPEPAGLVVEVKVPTYVRRGGVVTGFVSVTYDKRPVGATPVRLCVTDTRRVCTAVRTNAAGRVPLTRFMKSPTLRVEAAADVAGEYDGDVVDVLDGLQVRVRVVSGRVLVAAPGASGQTARLWRWDGSAWVDHGSKTLSADRDTVWTGLVRPASYRLDVGAGGGAPARIVNPVWVP
ncbi:MAG: S8 family serine peptidase [Actinobacteria bacterium]|nr:S8 family serine peptidase [Actinomycetota bacterium]